MASAGPNLSDEVLAERARQKLWTMLGRSTVYRQYLHHIGTGRVGHDNRNRLPWHAEGERQYAAFLLSSVGTPGGATVWTQQAVRPDVRSWDLVCLADAFQAMAASVYLWFEAIEDLADAAPLPKHIISRDVMPHPVMFWSRDVARVSEAGENNWLMLVSTPDGIRMWGDLTKGANDVQVGGGFIPYGRTYPDDFGGHTLDWVKRILSRLAFLNSPYIVPEQSRLPRMWRREASRDAVTAPIADPIISVVKLRREASENVVREREDGTHAIVRQHQWWVSGHYRAQWYPSQDAHKVIWIAPHLKGPADKPVLQKVYAVTR